MSIDKLPRVYANPINKEINNNKEYFYSKEETRNVRMSHENIERKINEIFASPTHVYKSRVNIITNHENLDEVIVGKRGQELLTINGKRIPIKDILEIEKR